MLCTVHLEQTFINYMQKLFHWSGHSVTPIVPTIHYCVGHLKVKERRVPIIVRTQ